MTITSQITKILLIVSVITVVSFSEQLYSGYSGITFKKCPLAIYCQIESSMYFSVLHERPTATLLNSGQFRILEDLDPDGVLHEIYAYCARLCYVRVFLTPTMVMFNHIGFNNTRYARHQVFPLDGGISPYNKSYDNFQSCLDDYCEIYKTFPSMSTLRCNANYSKPIHWHRLEKRREFGDYECEQSIKFLNLKGINIDHLWLHYFENFSLVRIDISGYAPDYATHELDFRIMAPWIDMRENQGNFMLIQWLSRSQKPFHIIRTDQNYYFNFPKYVEVFNLKYQCTRKYFKSNFTSYWNNCVEGKKFMVGVQLTDKKDRYTFPSHPFDEEMFEKERLNIDYMIKERNKLERVANETRIKEEEKIGKREIEKEEMEAEKNRTVEMGQGENEKLTLKAAEFGAGMDYYLEDSPYLNDRLASNGSNQANEDDIKWFKIEWFVRSTTGVVAVYCGLCLYFKI